MLVFDYKFGRSVVNMVILMIVVAVDNFSIYPRCMPIASVVAGFSHNLILCSGVMGTQWGYQCYYSN